jgi:hypothetical protein
MSSELGVQSTAETGLKGGKKRLNWLFAQICFGIIENYPAGHAKHSRIISTVRVIY